MCTVAFEKKRYMVLILKIISTANRYFSYYMHFINVNTSFSSVAIFADFLKKEIWSRL